MTHTAGLAVGALKLRIARRFPLEQIAQAHALLGTRGMGGKAVLDIA